MLYEQGDIVYYKKYKGIVKHIFPYNKSYIITLINYRGFNFIDKQIDQHDLYKDMQLELGAG